MNKQELLTKVFFERGYSIIDEGKVFNPKGRELKLGKTKDGYYSINLRLPKENPTRVFIHKLQAFKKFGDKVFEQAIVVRHLNGISTNNSWENIGIGSHSDNTMDIPKEVRIKRAKHAASFKKVKYNKEKVKKFHSKDNSYKKTMKEFNISSKGTLCYLLNT